MPTFPHVPSVPITAISAVSGMGRTTAEVLAALDGGRTGLRAPTFPLGFTTLVGAVPGELPSLPSGYARYDTRLARIGMMALTQIEPEVRAAIARWGKHRVAILIGTSTGGLDATEVAYATWAETGTLPASFDLSAQHDFNALGELYAAYLGVEGPVYVVSTACSSSGKVHASAARLMRAGLIDAALVGGIDSLCRMTLHGFRGLGILSETACRPFCAERNGINIGEGAGLMLLEREARQREAGSDVVLLGVGESSDAYNMSSPEPSGRGAREAMERALAQAGKQASDVDLVIAHGTATPQNDLAESTAIKAALPSAKVISTKGYTGHQLGAAGATSAIFAVHAIRTGFIPANLGAEPVDPALLGVVATSPASGSSWAGTEPSLEVITERRAAPLELVLANAFAFGGSNVCLAIGRAPSETR